MKVIKNFVWGIFFSLSLSTSNLSQIDPIHLPLLAELENNLAAIYHLPKYQVNLLLKDKQANQLLTQMEVQVDEQEKKSYWNIDFFHEAVHTEIPINDEVDHINLKLWAFEDSQNIYRKVSHPNSISDQIALLENRQPKAFTISKMKDIFFILPHRNSLGKLYPWQIGRTNEMLKVHAHRIQIPEDMFDNMRLGQIKWTQTLMASHTSTTQDNLVLHPSRSLNLSFDQKILSDNKVIGQLTGSFDSSQTMQKLTDVKLIVNPSKNLYQAQLTGLVQSFELNLFNLETAKFDTTNYILTITIQPLQEDIPGENEVTPKKLE